VPKQKRIQYPGMVTHVYSRGNEKKNIYRNDSDRYEFIDIIKESFKQYNYTLHAYTLMSNHYHLLIETHDGLLSRLMKFINGKYAGYFNWKHKRTGHVFQDRFKNTILEKDINTINAARYIHLNPLEKAYIKKLSDYKWCSYNEYTGKKGFGITDRRWVLGWFDKDMKKALKRFKMFLAEKNSQYEDAFKAGLGIDIAYSSKEFIENLKNKMLKYSFRIPKRIIKNGGASPEIILDVVAKEFDQNRESLLKKKGKYNYGKKTAIYLLKYFINLNTNQIADIFQINQSVISRHLSGFLEEIQSNITLQKIIKRIENQL